KKTNPTNLNLEILERNKQQNRTSSNSGFNQRGNRERNMLDILANADPSNSRYYRDISKCYFCHEEHASRFCNLTIEERKQKLEQRQICTKCLKAGHKADGCLNPIKCFKCNGEHPVNLCDSHTEPKRLMQSTSEPSTSNSSPPEVNTINLPNTGLTKIQIAINNNECFALFDSGSTNCVMSEEMMKNLNLKLNHEKVRINQAAISGMTIGTVTVNLQIGIKSQNQKFYVFPGLYHLILGVDAMSTFDLIRDPKGNILQATDRK
ncbi:hypothetical protein BLA29_006277, partial [Euroglyphus maynei]